MEHKLSVVRYTYLAAARLVIYWTELSRSTLYLIQNKNGLTRESEKTVSVAELVNNLGVYLDTSPTVQNQVKTIAKAC